MAIANRRHTTRLKKALIPFDLTFASGIIRSVEGTKVSRIAEGYEKNGIASNLYTVEIIETGEVISGVAYGGIGVDQIDVDVLVEGTKVLMYFDSDRSDRPVILKVVGNDLQGSVRVGSPYMQPGESYKRGVGGCSVYWRRDGALVLKGAYQYQAPEIVGETAYNQMGLFYITLGGKQGVCPETGNEIGVSIGLESGGQSFIIDRAGNTFMKSDQALSVANVLKTFIELTQFTDVGRLASAPADRYGRDYKRIGKMEQIQIGDLFALQVGFQKEDFPVKLTEVDAGYSARVGTQLGFFVQEMGKYRTPDWLHVHKESRNPLDEQPAARGTSTKKSVESLADGVTKNANAHNAHTHLIKLPSPPLPPIPVPVKTGGPIPTSFAGVDAIAAKAEATNIPSIVLKID